MRYETREVDSIRALVEVLVEHGGKLGEDFKIEGDGPIADVDRILKIPVWFRGLVDSDWTLLPSISRYPRALDVERGLMDRFKQNAAQELVERPAGEWEWMFLMRHHGLPSRLLDWTESALVGLYFAVTPHVPALSHYDEVERRDDVDGALWLLLPRLLNDHANLGAGSHLEIPMFDDSSAETEPVNMYKTTRLRPDGGVRPVAGIGVRGSRRMQAQAGVFTITHYEQTAIEVVGDGRHVWKYIVPKESKGEIRAQLELLGLSRLAIYPELDSVALAARRALGV